MFHFVALCWFVCYNIGHCSTFFVLWVHIQTTGILVGEKQKFQSTESQLQMIYEDIKQSKSVTVDYNVT